MRTLDKRIALNRRRFLQATGGTAVGAAALGGGAAALSSGTAFAQSPKALKPETVETLLVMARDIYPHDRFPDAVYLAAIQPYDEQAHTNGELRRMIEDGVGELNDNARAKHDRPYRAVAWEDDRVALLRSVEQGPLFQKLRADLVVSLYNQKDVWTKLGYEGSSFEQGGYLHRGFDDIDWLS